MQDVYEFRIDFCYEIEGVEPIRSELSHSLYWDYINCREAAMDFISDSKIKTREVSIDELHYDEIRAWVVSSNDEENKNWLKGAYFARIMIRERRIR